MTRRTSTPPPLDDSHDIGDSSHSADANTKSVAYSSALVGENLLDSPLTYTRRVQHLHDPSAGVNHHQLSATQLKQLMEENDQDTTGPSWMERGMTWWKKQKDRRERLHLQKLADEQRRILWEAEHGAAHSLKENTTFQQLTNVGSDETHDSHIRPSKSGLGVSVELDVFKDESSDFWTPETHVLEEEVKEGFKQSPFILNKEQRQSIASLGLPPSLSYCTWKRLYSLVRDGDSFETFLRLVEGYNHTLLVVRTTKGDIFGGYADSEWKAQHQGNPEFYGSAQAFLFRVDGDEARVFKWTGANRYIQFVDAKSSMLAFGGGGGSFGLCIQSDFQVGSTGTCATFSNEPLCADENFAIVDVECYGFLTGLLSPCL